MKSIILFIALCLATGLAQAQTPKYYTAPAVWSRIGGTGSVIFMFGYGSIADTSGGRMQMIYTPQQFPVAPSGAMTRIYFRVGGVPYPARTLCTYTSYEIRMGYTTLNAYKNIPGKMDSFITDLQTVFSASNYTLTQADSAGRWFSITPNRSNFFYDKTRNFVVEVRADAPSPQHPVGYSIYSAGFMPGDTALRFISGAINSPVAASHAEGGHLDFGFDQTVTGVGELGNITSLGLFPNPSTDGRFNISFEAAQNVRSVAITVTDAVGRQVYQQQYSNTGKRFFKEVDMSGAADGNYFVKVLADGEVVTRRVVVE